MNTARTTEDELKTIQDMLFANGFSQEELKEAGYYDVSQWLTFKARKGVWHCIKVGAVVGLPIAAISYFTILIM